MLEPATYGFSESDLEREIDVSMTYNSSIAQRKRKWLLKDLLAAYREAYCGKIGSEFMHIKRRDVCNWIREEVEGIQFNRPSEADRIHMYRRLNAAH